MRRVEAQLNLQHPEERSRFLLGFRGCEHKFPGAPPDASEVKEQKTEFLECLETKMKPLPSYHKVFAKCVRGPYPKMCLCCARSSWALPRPFCPSLCMIVCGRLRVSPLANQSFQIPAPAADSTEGTLRMQKAKGQRNVLGCKFYDRRPCGQLFLSPKRPL